MAFISNNSINTALAAVHARADEKRAALFDSVLLLEDRDDHRNAAFDLDIDSIDSFGTFTAFDDKQERPVVILDSSNKDGTTKHFFPKETVEELDEILTGQRVTDAMRFHWRNTLERIRDEEHSELAGAINQLYDNETNRLERMEIEATIEKDSLRRELRDIPLFRPREHLKAIFTRTEVAPKPDADELKRKIQDANTAIFGAGIADAAEATKALDQERERELARLDKDLASEKTDDWMVEEVDEMTKAYKAVRQAEHTGTEPELDLLANRWKNAVSSYYSDDKPDPPKQGASIHVLG